MTMPYGSGYSQDPMARQMAQAAQQLVTNAQAAIDAYRPSVGGPVTVAALSLGQSATVVVPFAPEIIGTFVPIVSLQATATLLGGLTVQGVVATTSTSVSVLVKAPLIAVAAGATVSVACFRLS